MIVVSLTPEPEGSVEFLQREIYEYHSPLHIPALIALSFLSFKWIGTASVKEAFTGTLSTLLSYAWGTFILGMARPQSWLCCR